MSEEAVLGAEPVTAPTEPTWWVDEGVPGTGSRPAWLGEKFKTAADLAKSYSDLEKRVGTPPDDYDFSKASWMDPDYAPFQELKDLAKSKRVPAEVMDKMIDSMDKYMNEFTIDVNEETVKLGENGKQRIELLNNWAKANFSDESFVALTSNMRTADSIKALEEVRKKMMDNTTTIPGGNDSATSNAPSMEEIQSELNANLAKYKTDKKYQAEIRQKMELASKSSSFVDKAAG